MATKEEKQSALDCYLKAQKEMGKALKQSHNPFYASKGKPKGSAYADLSNVLEACMEAFHNNGFIVTQPSGRDEAGNDYVDTILTHVTGATFVSRVPLILEKQTMQGLGSAITYARRYGALQMACIAPEDDDGNEAELQPRKELPIPIKPETKGDF
jgi:hypothetical protein|tara:strand:+ start:76 stop:543 length:468 start_codon:yes stop_codon:yes gene_type:complete